MAFHPIDNTVEVVTFASRAGEERRNVFHYLYGLSRPTAAELTNLANDVVANILPKQAGCTVLGTVWYQVTVRDIHDQFGLQVAVPCSVAANLGTDVLPGACSVCLSKRTDLPGRSRRGRFYLFDIDEAMSNGDDLNPAFNVPIGSLVTELLLARQSGRFAPSVASRVLQNSVKMTHITWDQIFDTQVRRGKGRGR